MNFPINRLNLIIILSKNKVKVYLFNNTKLLYTAFEEMQLIIYNFFIIFR